MNEQMIKGKWTEIKGEIQKTWGNVTGDELEQTKGDLKSIAGLIQQKYGIAQEETMKKISTLIGKFDDKIEERKNDFKKSMDNK